MILWAKANTGSAGKHEALHYYRRNHRARRKTVQGAAGQAGDDAGITHGEGEVGVVRSV